MAISIKRVQEVFNKAGLNEDIKKALLKDLQFATEDQPKEEKKAAVSFPLPIAAAAAAIYFYTQS
jgi:hypothetical protein